MISFLSRLKANALHCDLAAKCNCGKSVEFKDQIIQSNHAIFVIHNSLKGMIYMEKHDQIFKSISSDEAMKTLHFVSLDQDVM